MGIDMGTEELGKIITIRYSGIITISDIINNWIEVISKKLINEEVQGFILDCRSTDMNLDLEEISVISDLFKSNLHLFNKKRFAYLTSSPNQIILPLLLQEDEHFYESKPFSTKEAAVHWLMN